MSIPTTSSSFSRPLLLAGIAVEQPAAFPSRAPAEPRRAKPAAGPASAKGWKAGWHSWLALNATELTWTALIAGGAVVAALFGGR